MSNAALEGEKILVTGATGAIALPAARFLAQKNEVWGVARFSDVALRAELEEAGDLSGKTPTYHLMDEPGAAKGAVVDTTRVRKIVGPCKRRFRQEFAKMVTERKST